MRAEKDARCSHRENGKQPEVAPFGDHDPHRRCDGRHGCGMTGGKRRCFVAEVEPGETVQAVIDERLGAMTTGDDLDELHDKSGGQHAHKEKEQTL